MKWERTDNLFPINKIYELFTNGIKANISLNFMTSFEHEGITYIASPQNFDNYPDELLNTDEQKFSLWKLNLDE